MKKCLILCLLAFVICVFYTNANYLAPADSFKLEGTILSTSKSKLSGVILSVFLKTKKSRTIVNTAMTNYLGNFNIYLNHNKSYEIELQKRGYQNQIVSIETKVTPAIISGGGIEIAYDNKFTMYNYYPGVDYSFFNKPVEYWEYDPNKLFFNNNMGKSPTSKLKKITAEILLRKQKDFARLKTSADSVFGLKKHELALDLYSQAHEILPDDNSVVQLIAECKKIIKKGKNATEQYKDLMAKADKLFNELVYVEAREKYIMARNFNEKETRALRRLTAIDSILAIQYQQKIAEEKLTAQRLIEQRKRDSIITIKEKAIKDSLAQAKIKIKEEEDARKKQEEANKIIDEKYNKIVKTAEGYFIKKDFANAIAIYKQASEVKPNEELPKTKITEAQQLLNLQASERLKAQKNKKTTDSIASLEKNKQQAQTTTKEAKEVKKESNNANQSNTSIEEMIAKADKIAKSNNKSEAAKLYTEIASQLSHSNNLGQSLTNYNKALEIYRKSEDKISVAFTLNQISAVMIDSGLYKESINAKNEVLALKKQLGDTKGELEIMKEIGEVYLNTYKTDEAENIYIEALNRCMEVKDPQQETVINEKLGDLYTEKNDLTKAIITYNQALALAIKQKDAVRQGALLNNLGVVNLKSGKFEQAIQFFSQTVTLEKKSGNLNNASYALNNIGNINYERKQYNTAILYYEKALVLKKEAKNEEGVATSLLNIGIAYLRLKKYDRAEEYFKQSLDICNKTNYREGLARNYQFLSQLYDQTAKYKDAVNAFKKYILYFSASVIGDGPITEMQSMYSYEKGVVSDLRRQLQKQRILTDYESMQNLQKQQLIELKELEIKNNESKVLRQQILLGFTLICLVLAVFMGYHIYHRYKEKKLSAEVIAFQNKQITDSITYARRIQQAVLPPNEYLKDCLQNSFVLSKPKDIVSGDFYYTCKKEDLLYVVVADCTGHGVPGAFMSMLSISILKEIISNDQTGEANIILDKLRDAIIHALNQSGRDDEAKDGMDFSMVIVDSKNRKLKYAGANNKGLIINNKTIKELLADRMPIGIHPIMKPFHCETVELKPNDTIYLYSDGFCDQIGEVSNKKFKIRQFVELLIEISPLPLDEQQRILEDRLETWKGQMEQTDDITVVGFKV